MTGRGGKNERELAENPVICLDANYLIAGTSDERPESAHLPRWIGGSETFRPPALQRPVHHRGRLRR